MSYSRAVVVNRIRQRLNVVFGGSFAAYVATLNIDAILDDVIREEIETQARDLIRKVFLEDPALAKEMSDELSLRP